MRRAVGSFFLHAAYLFIALMIVGPIVRWAYGLLIRLGMQTPPDMLIQHFLFSALLLGLLTGLLPVDVLLATMGWFGGSSRLAAPMRNWRGSQQWFWLPFFCIMLLRVCFWIAGKDAESVLQTTHVPLWSRIVSHFFGADCLLTGNFTIYDLLGCPDQVLYTRTFVEAIGYSLASLTFGLRDRRPVDETGVAETSDADQPRIPEHIERDLPDTIARARITNGEL